MWQEQRGQDKYVNKIKYNLPNYSSIFKIICFIRIMVIKSVGYLRKTDYKNRKVYSIHRGWVRKKQNDVLNLLYTNAKSLKVLRDTPKLLVAEEVLKNESINIFSFTETGQ